MYNHGKTYLAERKAKKGAAQRTRAYRRFGRAALRLFLTVSLFIIGFVGTANAVGYPLFS